MSIIDEHLQLREENRRPRNPTHLYTTDLTHPCLRQIWLDYFNDRIHPVETLRIFVAGRLIEDYWVDVLQERKDITVIDKQVPARYFFNIGGEDWEIHGRADILCQHNFGQLVLHEVKSAKTTHWMRKPKEDHVTQLQFYMHILGVENGQIDYLDKKSLLIGDNPIDKSFKIRHDPNSFYRTIQVAGQVVDAIQKGTVPPSNPKAWSGRVCDYCLYEDLCKENEK